MVRKLRVVLFYLFLSFLLIFDGWGVMFGWNIVHLVMYLTPIIFFSTYLIRKEKISVPPDIVLLFGLFMFTSILSTIFAVNIQDAFEHQLYYLAVILIFLFVYNNASAIKAYFIPFLMGSSAISLCYSAFLYISGDAFFFLRPKHSDQLLYRFEGDISHYPHGVFLLLLIVVFYVYLLYRPRLYSIFAVSVSLILLWLSYLRAAYISFIGVVLIHATQVNKKITAMISGMIILGSIIFILLPIATERYVPVITELRGIIVFDDPSLNDKDFSNGRMEFIKQAMQAIQERPITGYGPNNFYYASLFFTKNVDYVVGTSHNMYLDAAAEQGIIAAILIFIITTLIVRRSWQSIRNKNIIDTMIFSLCIALLILFQFNYYQKLPYLFVLFFVVSGLVYKEKEAVYDTYKVPLLASIVGVLGVIIASAMYLDLKGNQELALKIYPLYGSAYRRHIADLYQKGFFEKMDDSVDTYVSFYKRVPRDMEFMGDFYMSHHDQKRALEYYLMALQSAPRETGYITKVYETLKMVESEDAAKEFIEQHLVHYPVLYGGMQFEDREWFVDWCIERRLNCHDF